jgi:hypothetical protein
MRKSISLGTSAAVAALVTYGLVWSAVHFEEPSPASAAPFRQALAATEWLWSAAHGWPAMSHIRDFGAFYAPAVRLTGPLLGFGLLVALRRRKPGTDVWSALALCVVLAVVPGLPSSPWLEAARSAAALAAMVSLPGRIGALKRSVSLLLTHYVRPRPC